MGERRVLGKKEEDEGAEREKQFLRPETVKKGQNAF